MRSIDDRRRLRERVLAEAPGRPGVYTWLGADGDVLYVGKSVNLQRRMLSYLTDRAAGPKSRQRHLSFAIEDFRFQETRGELLALLLEDAVIKRLGPRHNVRQRDFLERRYLLLTDDPFPTCIIVEGPSARPGTLFGPFKDQYFVAGLIELIGDDFGLRTCAARQPFRRSARFDLGTCPGPCRGAIFIEQYFQVVGRVRAFLAGDGSWVETRLVEQMEAAAAALEFERAAEVREQLAFCRRFADRQRFLSQFQHGRVLVNEDSSGLVYSFERGRLRSLGHGKCELALPPELSEPVGDPRFLLDRANVVYTWAQRSVGS